MSELVLPLPEAPDGVSWTLRSLEILDPSLPFERFEELFAAAGEIKTAASFWLGDLLNFSEARYGHRYAQVMDATGFAYSTLSNYAYVCRQIAPSRRRRAALDGRWRTLKFSHYDAVAALEPGEQEAWLDRAEAEALTREALREAIQAAGRLEARPKREVTARGKTLDPAGVVDAARNLSTVQETLAKVGGGLEAETAEAVGIPGALRALGELDATVREAVATLDRPSEFELAGRRVVAQATRSGGFAMIPIVIFEEFAALIRAAQPREG